MTHGYEMLRRQETSEFMSLVRQYGVQHLMLDDPRCHEQMRSDATKEAQRLFQLIADRYADALRAGVK